MAIAARGRGAAVAGLLLLAACGGGGGVASTPPPPVATTPDPVSTPAPAPSPSPTAAAPTSSNDTAEYRATVGAVSMNALAAYDRAATGAGVGIGIIDSGVDLQSEEFGTRISSASQSVAGNASIDDEAGHGTAVAFTSAGRRNGAGAHGVAFDATLVVLRADRPGSCATAATDDSESGCRYGTDAIARGVDAARTAGTRVVNISLGGSEMPATLRAAIGRATAAGMIVVIAAGNDGTANPDAFTSVANDQATARGLVVIAGSIGAGGAISSFSDRAGTSAAHFLAAVGERVRAPDAVGNVRLWSGTSFAAPQISGAIALLAQAFPNMTGAQIVDLLFATARDLGDAGVDAIYGRGAIDLTRAFQPVGATVMAGTTAGVSLTANGTMSAPMGDARQAGLGAVILDRYDRAFAIDLAGTMRAAGLSATLRPILDARLRSVGAAVGGTTVAMTLAPRPGGGVPGALSIADAAGARAIAGAVTQRLGDDLALGFAAGQGAQGLSARLAGRGEPAFLVAGERGLGFDARADGAAAVRRRVGATGVTLAAENGRVLTWREDGLRGADPWNRTGYASASMMLDRRIGALTTWMGATRLDEAETMLGARFGTIGGATRATSWFADWGARAEPGDGWTLGASVRRGWTDARLRIGVAARGSVRTGAFSADIGKAGVLGSDSLGLRVAQPLRVDRGGIDLRLPTNWDYATEAVDAWTVQRLNLAPTGREIDVEARYARALGGGELAGNLFWRRDPGNRADLAADVGVALRWARGF